MRRMSFDQSVKVVPVLDLLHGQVVRAQRGERSAYRPIISGLAEGSDPCVLARALLAAADSEVLYVADLDAIQGGAVQLAVLAQLLAACPGVTVWLDAGFGGITAAHAVRSRLGADGARVRAVFGSESLASLDALAGLAADPRAILSLDFRHAAAMDPAGCRSQPALWPRSVIVMTLDHVGAGRGPDLATFGSLRAAAPHNEWIGAGGVRDGTDLLAAASAGASAWLVASALHDQSLGVSPVGR
jgi:uncharacterized protein related to proFAR isomerase